MKSKLTTLGPATVVTAVCAVAWLGAMAYRTQVPDWPGGATADALMTTIVGAFFAKQGVSKK